MIPVRLRYIFLLCLQCIYLFASGANPSRKIISFNNGWQFKKDSSAEFSSIVNLTSWQSVRIPHTWNAFDVMDDQTGYYRGNGIYRKTLRLNEEQKHKNLFIQFEAAGQQAILYVNGKKVATHYGGYTQFIVPLTNYLTPEGENELLLAVDNKYNEHLPPLTADFTFFGGLYRDVSLIETNKAYFGDHVFGAHGVYVSTPKVSSESADVSITAKLNNSLDETQRFRLKSTIYSFKNEVVKSTETAVILSPGEELSVSQQIMAIRNPTLWSPQRPYL